MKQIKNIKKIVLYSPGHIGDFIWFTSIFPIIKSCEPDANIILIISANCKKLVDSKFDFNIIPINEKYFFNKSKFIRYGYKFLFLFFAFQIFAADSLFLFSKPPSFFVEIFKKIYRIKNIICGNYIYSGSTIKEKHFKYCSKIVDFENIKNKHIMLKQQQLIRSIYNTYNLSIPILPNTSYLYDKIKDLIKDTKQYRIALNTRGSADWKYLDINFLKNLIIKTNNSYTTTFFIIGAGNTNFDDTTTLKKLLPETDIRSIYNKTSLLELIEFMKNINILISIDTGAVHIAAAVNTPVISLCGPTLPVQSAPISYNGITLYSARNCSPCDAKLNNNIEICKDMKCLKDITVEQVFKETQKIFH